MTNVSNYDFARMLANLQARIRVIRTNFYRLSSRERERHLDAASALCQNLWLKMQIEEIDPLPYIALFGELQGDIDILKIKSESGGGARGLFGLLFRAFATVLNLISSLVGIGPLLPNPSQQLRLLE